ncbi:MAG: hypothetical protein KAS32_27620 [Candidatus Peribacteraceae bacterium]|nr:hypothetical protein [Candidatus Peribacteraceae bacterium]
MSADMMIICKEDNSNFEGDTDKALFVDETSMGCPWYEFGAWFQERYCKAPSMLEQLHGVKKHNYIKLTDADLVAIKYALVEMPMHESANKNEIIDYIEKHIGLCISTENW